MTTSVSFDRSSLSLSPLVVGLYSLSATYFLAGDGVFRADFAMRRGYAPDSSYIPGKRLLTAVADAGTLPVVIYVQSDSTTDLQAAMDVLTTAATQWSYDVTLTIDGVAKTYQADPEFPQWGQVDNGMMRAFMARASIQIPVNPA